MDYVRDIPVEMDRGTMNGRALLERRVIDIPDVQKRLRLLLSATAQQLGHYRTDSWRTHAARRYRDWHTHFDAIGSAAVHRQAHSKSVSIFADQEAIAIENARSFDEVQAQKRELTEKRSSISTATSEVLSVISRSPANARPVF